MKLLIFSIFSDSFKVKLRLLPLTDSYCTEFTLFGCHASLFVVDEVGIDSFFSWEVDEEKGTIAYSHITAEPSTSDDIIPIISFFFKFARLVTTSNINLADAIAKIVPDVLKEE